MSSKRTALLTDLQIESAASEDHAAPSSGTDGLSTDSWKSGAFSPDAAMVYLGSASTGIAIAAGAYVAGYVAKLDEWFKIADLNAGAAIALTANVGYGQRVIDVGGFDRLAVVDGGDTGTHKYGFIPIEVIEG